MWIYLHNLKLKDDRSASELYASWNQDNEMFISNSGLDLPMALTLRLHWPSDDLDIHMTLTYIFDILIWPSDCLDLQMTFTFIWHWPSDCLDLQMTWHELVSNNSLVNIFRGQTKLVFNTFITINFAL